ncbi:hypothetical protein EW146_g4080 [Bondarzewia mesenterica]|uniref:PPM-type phosphatase domain-containing protein n=1 Tax=Bondarzewia mesenterica TaxID=1095465 RepID=A0A4V3XF93_9AGAM|nr:hypothetical protein EW146_g4080 [Bondarzewia mesenterica]
MAENVDLSANSSPFEGPEKLLEIWFARSAADLPDASTTTNGKFGLRKVPRNVWEEMLAIVKCQVLSIIEGAEMDAYLLSESSFFVSPHRLILKTCGTTLNLFGLPRILDIARDHASLPSVYRCFYSRKSYFFPERQKGPHREWKNEVEFLDGIFENGAAYTVGKVNGDHWLLYLTSPSGDFPNSPITCTTTLPELASMTKVTSLTGDLPKPAQKPDYTIEILMTNLSSDASKAFAFGDDVSESEESPSSRALTLSSAIGISDLYPSHLTTLDAYAFSPCGYSSNALLKWGRAAEDGGDGNAGTDEEGGEGYYTIHVTPEEGWSYASFECNVPLTAHPTSQARSIPDLRTLVRRVVDIFKPGRLSLTLFVSCQDNNEADEEGGETAVEAAQRAFRAALTSCTSGPAGGVYKRTDKINYEFGGYDLAFASFELYNLRALDEVRDFATTDMGRGGLERWTYRLLSEPQLSNELRRLANPSSKENIDSVTFQPCPMHEFRNQDRSRVEHWPLPGGTWVFTAIFDGHAGHATVDHAAQTIPAMVKHSLDAYLRSPSRTPFSPDRISNILSDVILRFDHSVTTEFLKLFPGGPSALQRLSSGQIKQVIDDRANGGRNMSAAIRCLEGSTALVTLTDPAKSHLWVANLGDCQAGTRILYSCKSLIADQLRQSSVPEPPEDNGLRVLLPHFTTATICRSSTASEASTQANGTVPEITGSSGFWDLLGVSSLIYNFYDPCISSKTSPAVGDTWLKLPAIYSQRVLLGLRHDWNVERPGDYIARIISPPYVSSTPDVYHLPLPRGTPGRPRDFFLLMCSDGLADLYDERSRMDMANRWVRTIGRYLDSRGRGNVALHLLRDALGGEDTRLVSRYLTVEMEEKWMDDVTIMVQRF